MRRTARTRIRQAALSLATIVGVSMIATPAVATPGDSFSVPMFSDRSETLWPLEVSVEIVALGRAQTAGEVGKTIVPERELVVADGQHTTFSEVVATPRGQRAFEVELVARHHAGGKIELEYDLHVRQAKFERLTWGDYVLHRLVLAPRPRLGPAALAAARADIVETEGEVHAQRFTVDGDLYEVRLRAETMRG